MIAMENNSNKSHKLFFSFCGNACLISVRKLHAMMTQTERKRERNKHKYGESANGKIGEENE